MGAKQVTKAIRSKANKSKIVFDDEGNEEKRDEDNDSDDDFNIAEASERLKQADEEDDGELLPETNDFLANLTMPDHVASDDDSEEEYNGSDDVTPAKRVKLAENTNDYEDDESEEDDDEDVEKLEAMAMAHL